MKRGNFGGEEEEGEEEEGEKSRGDEGWNGG